MHRNQSTSYGTEPTWEQQKKPLISFRICVERSRRVCDLLKFNFLNITRSYLSDPPIIVSDFIFLYFRSVTNCSWLCVLIDFLLSLSCVKALNDIWVFVVLNRTGKKKTTQNLDIFIEYSIKVVIKVLFFVQQFEHPNRKAKWMI